MLIHKGPTAVFQNYDGLEIANMTASDQDGNGVPDGMVSLGASLTMVQGGVDLDQDGRSNATDSDIDGDGVINLFDPDDDGDAVLDVFDGDANGDVVNDEGQTDGGIGDQFFSKGINYLTVQFEMLAQESGVPATSLTFTADVFEDVAPIAVQVRGAPSLLNGAMVTTKNAEGASTTSEWNRSLSDDGASGDGGKDDLVFARKITLADGRSPRAHDVVFVQLVFGSTEQPWYLEFPYAFPPVVPAQIIASYDPNLKVVRLIGDPFGGGVQDFTWSIRLENDTGKNIWTSRPVSGTERQFPIQDNVTEAGKTYKFRVVAQTLPKVAGYPAYSIESLKYSFTR
jgi:hypothetical protein